MLLIHLCNSILFCYSLGKKQETESSITHNERLEFLGDAVVEFLASIHLYHMFPDLEEGGLATYRAAIVQNQHLAQLAKNLQLDQFMLYAHGSDLCHDLELRHAVWKSHSRIYLLNIFVKIRDTWCLICIFILTFSHPFPIFIFLHRQTN